MQRLFPSQAAIRHYLPLALTLTACVALTLSLFSLARRSGESRARRAFDQQAGELANDLNDDMAHHLDQLYGIESYYNVDGAVSRQGFHQLSQANFHHFPDLQALEWIPRVRDDERAAYEANAQGDGLASFQFLDKAAGALVPAAQRAEYFPVYYVEPLQGNGEALGVQSRFGPDAPANT